MKARITLTLLLVMHICHGAQESQPQAQAPAPLTINRTTAIRLATFYGIIGYGAGLYFGYRPFTGGNWQQIKTIIAPPKETFDDIAGAHEAKELMQEIVEYLKNPQKYSKLGAKPPKGILLVGPPGNGKTLLARTLAGEAKCHFINKSGSDLASTQYAGTGAAAIRALFAQARKKTPCVIFIDEIDAVGAKRSYGDSSAASQDAATTLNQLLTELDGFVSKGEPIIVIAATNRPEILDEALTRSGRIERHVEVPNPSLKDREEILHIHAKKTTVDRAVDFEALARCTTGFSGADLASLVEQATRIASKAQRETVTMLDIREAWMTKMLGGKENKSKILTQQDRKETAYHEAGHALIVLLLPQHTDPLHLVTIIPRGAALGVTVSVPERDKISLTKEEILASITRLMGGRAAEELMFNQLNSGASNDLQRATNMARNMVCNLGMSELGPIIYDGSRHYSPMMADRINEQVSAILNSCYERACGLLKTNQDKLTKLAEELLEKNTLGADEIYPLLEIEPRICPQLMPIHPQPPKGEELENQEGKNDGDVSTY
jgi:cell division protease FtsH